MLIVLTFALDWIVALGGARMAVSSAHRSRGNGIICSVSSMAHLLYVAGLLPFVGPIIALIRF